MPSHHQPANILPLHRGVRPIPVEHYERIFRMPAHAEQDRIQQQLRDYGDIPVGVAIVERIGEALGSDNAFRCYVSFIAGSFFTLAMAYLWSVVL